MNIFTKYWKSSERKYSLDCTSVTVIPDEDRSPISNDPVARSKSLDYLKWAIDCSAAFE